jgi:hypothetical protein
MYGSLVRLKNDTAGTTISSRNGHFDVHVPSVDRSEFARAFRMLASVVSAAICPASLEAASGSSGGSDSNTVPHLRIRRELSRCGRSGFAVWPDLKG